MPKKNILVVWPAHREDWVLPFKSLSSEFEFFFLSGINQNHFQDNYVANFAHSIYWSEFDSASNLIKTINPSKIIFMALESGLNIALNIVAKRQGITTYILQHGIYTNYKDYRIREKLWRKSDLTNKNETFKFEANFNSFSWINKSLQGKEKINIPFIYLLTRAAKKLGPYWAAKHLSFEGKKPDQYLCFSPYNATIHKELDKIKEDRIIYIGSPELACYTKVEKNLIDESFYLHIDQAMAENSFGEETVSKDQMINFYLKLNEFCKMKSAKLYIKLHPESYKSVWLPKDDNIEYLKNVENFNRFIQSAKGCFGFYSTMVIPVVYWKPTILFEIFYSGLQEALSDIKNVKILPFCNFQISDIKFADSEIDQDAIIERFFYHKEPISLDLLEEIFNG